MKLSTNSTELLYQQIKNQIISAIFDESLKPGDLLPSIRMLALEIGTSIITVKKAYEDLENLGYTYTRPVKGSFIAEDAFEIARAEKMKIVEEGLANILSECNKLGMGEEEIINLLKKCNKKWGKENGRGCD